MNQEEKGNWLDKEILAFIDLFMTVDKLINHFRKSLSEKTPVFLHDIDNQQFYFFVEQLEQFQIHIDDIYNKYICSSTTTECDICIKSLKDLLYALVPVGDYIKTFTSDDHNINF